MAGAEEQVWLIRQCKGLAMKSAEVIKTYEHSKANQSVISTCFPRRAAHPPPDQI